MENPDIELIYQRQVKNVYRTAMVLLGNPADAEDITSEVFMRYMKKPPCFKDPEHEKAWFLTVTRNCCKDLWRTAWRRKAVLGEIPEIAICPEEERGIIEDVMALPYKLREVVYLRYYEGYSVQEISQMTHTSASTLRSRLAKAKKLLKETLSDTEEALSEN